MKLQELLSYNTHWDAADIPLSPYVLKRKAFHAAAAYLQSRVALVIRGLRRVGKSVLAGQLVEATANRLGVTSPHSILFYTFESEDASDLIPTTELNELLETYFLQILRKSVQTISEPVIICLDEIQNVDNWQSVIKKYYDLSDKLKFIITGSSSLFIGRGVESLAGRTYELELSCLDFQEFLQFVGVDTSFEVACTNRTLNPPRPILVSEDLRELFDAFLLCGAFPDTALMFRDKFSIKDCQKFIRDGIVTKVLLRDLKRYYKVQNAFYDVRLFEACCHDNGSFVEWTNLAREVGLSVPSIKKHMDIFCQTGLLSTVNKYDRKIRRQIFSSPKVYIASPSIAYAMLREETTRDSATAGHMVEGYIYQRLRTLDSEILVDRTHGQVEVDFYLPQAKHLIECKYANRVNSRMFGYLLERAKKNHCSPWVVSKDQWSLDNLSMVPAMFF